MSAKSEFAKHLKKIFKKVESEIEDVASKLKVDVEELTEWVKGNHSFSMQEAIKVGKLTDTDPAEIIYLQKAVEKEAAEKTSIASKLKKAVTRKKVATASEEKPSGHTHSPAIATRPSERSICR